MIKFNVQSVLQIIVKYIEYYKLTFTIILVFKCILIEYIILIIIIKY